MTEDEQAIGKIVGQLEAAWNASDSAGFAAPFMDDATFIHIYGGQLDGRGAIEASHRQIFDTIYKGSYGKFTIQRIRFVRPDVAIVLVQGYLKFHEGGETREMHARPTIIAEKQNRTWRIVALQNTRVSEMPGAIRGR
jgi:uncharacterized protein (TIGR02246 family)